MRTLNLREQRGPKPKKKIGRPKLDFEIRKKIALRAAKGQSPYAIAKALGVDRHTAAKYANSAF